MLFQSLKTDLASSTNNENAVLLFQQYEKQREHFLTKRLSTQDGIYNLTEKEKKILIAYFNTAEREYKTEDSGENYVFRLLSSFKHQALNEDSVDNNPENIAILGWLRAYWSSAWREFAEDNKLILSARFTISRSNEKKLDRHVIAMSINELVADLKEILPSAEKALGLPLSADDITNPKAEKNGTLSLDQKMLDWLAQNNIGNSSTQYIKTFKALISSDNYSINKRLDVWDNPLYFVRELAQLRWKDRVEKFVLRKKETPPALTFNIASQITRTISKQTSLNKENNKLLDSHGRVISNFDPVACMPIITAQNILQKHISQLSSKAADHVLRWMVLEGYKQHFQDIKEPNILHIKGGWERLGELSEAGTSNKAIEKIKQIISILTGCGYSYESKQGTVTGNLLSYEHIQARGQKSSSLKLILSRPLCPGLVEELPEGPTRYRRERFLVPVVGMPCFVGEPKTHASQSNFQWQLIIEMRLRATEVYHRGGILLDNDTKMSLAKKASLSSHMVNAVMDTWIHENYLEKIDDCVFFLGSRYPEAQMMLKEAGENQVAGSEAGKKQKEAKKMRFKKVSSTPPKP